MKCAICPRELHPGNLSFCDVCWGKATPDYIQDTEEAAEALKECMDKAISGLDLAGEP